MSHNQIGLRIDGRRPAELRKITSTTCVLSQADGSAYLEHGNTKVLAAVYGPREARHRALVLHDRAILNVELNVAPFSTGERRRRSKNDKYVLLLFLSLPAKGEVRLATRLLSN